MKTLQVLLRLIVHAFKVCDRDLADSIKEKDIPSAILNAVLIILMLLGIALTIVLLIYLAFKFWWVPFIGFIVAECLFALLNKSGTSSIDTSVSDVDIELARQRAGELYPTLRKFMFRVILSVSHNSIISRISDPHDIETVSTSGEHFYMTSNVPVYQFEVETEEEVTEEEADSIREKLQRKGTNYISDYPMLVDSEAGGRSAFEVLRVYPLGRRICVDIVLTTATSIKLIDDSRRARAERKIKQERSRPYIDEDYGE